MLKYKAVAIVALFTVVKGAGRMGKSLKGKEIGKGISQRKDGLYCARFINKRGERQGRCFSTLLEARNWLNDAKHTDKSGNAFTPSTVTVDDWFEDWINLRK